MRHIISISLVLAIVAVLFAPITAIAADNSALQAASTINTTAIQICAQDYATPVGTITFPAAVPGSTVSVPYNNVNGSGSAQSFGDAGVAHPVVTLVNTDPSFQMVAHCTISTWSEDTVTEEYYLVNLKATACLNESAIDQSVTFGEDMNIGQLDQSTVVPGSQRDLYLKVKLSETGGLNGTSTISILSERP